MVNPASDSACAMRSALSMPWTLALRDPTTATDGRVSRTGATGGFFVQADEFVLQKVHIGGIGIKGVFGGNTFLFAVRFYSRLVEPIGFKPQAFAPFAKYAF